MNNITGFLLFCLGIIVGAIIVFIAIYPIIKDMFKYVKKGILAENLALDTIQPEMMHVQICTYLNLLEGLCK